MARNVIGQIQETEKERAAKQKHQTVADERVFECLTHGCEEINLFDCRLEFYRHAFIAADLAEFQATGRAASRIYTKVAEVPLALLAFVFGEVLIVVFAIDRFLFLDSRRRE